MRELWIVIWCVLVTPCLAQFEYAQEQPANLGQAIGVGAERSYAQKVKDCLELEAKLEKAQQEINELKALVSTLKGEAKLAAVTTPKIVEEMLVDAYGESICPGCEAWWTGPEPKDLRAKGWIVEKVAIDRPIRGKLYPRWRVCIGDECGFIEFTKDFKSALQAHLDSRKKP